MTGLGGSKLTPETPSCTLMGLPVEAISSNLRSWWLWFFVKAFWKGEALAAKGSFFSGEVVVCMGRLTSLPLFSCSPRTIYFRAWFSLCRASFFCFKKRSSCSNSECSARITFTSELSFRFSVCRWFTSRSSWVYLSSYTCCLWCIETSFFFKNWNSSVKRSKLSFSLFSWNTGWGGAACCWNAVLARGGCFLTELYFV